MNSSVQIKILQAKKNFGKPFDITVTGISMNPALYKNDIVTVVPENNYIIGDILVFIYNQNELLIHRLMEIKDSMYYLKGDNALRMEKVSDEQIVGKAIKITRANQDIPILCSDKLITVSKAVNRLFFKCRYDPIKTRQTYMYKIYEKILLYSEDIEMYVRNDKMDYIDADESSMAVFDPETEDTHFIDETGIDMLKILELPHDLNGLIQKLCEIYEVTSEDIEDDVKEFLGEAMQKGIVIEI